MVSRGDVRLVPRSAWPTHSTLNGVDGWWGLVLDARKDCKMAVYDPSSHLTHTYTFATSAVNDMKPGKISDLAIRNEYRLNGLNSATEFAQVSQVPGKGRGLIATRDIAPLTFVGTYAGVVFPVVIFEHLVDIHSIDDTYAAQTFVMARSSSSTIEYPNGHYTVNPSRSILLPVHFINEPSGRLSHNCMWVWNLARQRVEIWTETSIKTGEELTLCYGGAYRRSYSATTCLKSKFVSPRRYVFPGYSRPRFFENHMPVLANGTWVWKRVKTDGSLAGGKSIAALPQNIQTNTGDLHSGKRPRSSSQPHSSQSSESGSKRARSATPGMNALLAAAQTFSRPPTRPPMRPPPMRPPTRPPMIPSPHGNYSSYKRYIPVELDNNQLVLFPIEGDHVLGNPVMITTTGEITPIRSINTLYARFKSSSWPLEWYARALEEASRKFDRGFRNEGFTKASLLYSNRKFHVRQLKQWDYKTTETAVRAALLGLLETHKNTYRNALVDVHGKKIWRIWK